jgi:hypothetical protein
LVAIVDAADAETAIDEEENVPVNERSRLLARRETRTGLLAAILRHVV